MVVRRDICAIVRERDARRRVRAATRLAEEQSRMAGDSESPYDAEETVDPVVPADEVPITEGPLRTISEPAAAYELANATVRQEAEDLPSSPLGMRLELKQRFLADVLRDWRENGLLAVDRARSGRPLDYLKLIHSLLPADREIEDRQDDGRTDEQIIAEIERKLQRLAAEGVEIGLRAGGAQTGEPAGDVPPLPEAG
jgi:hypothetical protein